jgi:putative membrane protein
VSLRDYFSQAELDQVRDATRRAEGGTAGELVCVIVQRSDGYEDARWRAATLGALAGGLVAAYGIYAIESWSPLAPLWPAVAPLAGAAAAWLLATGVPAIERELAGFETMRRRVRQGAARAFVVEEVFATRQRTGVLIFLSLFERRVEIVCDEGIRALVPAAAWTEISTRLASGITRGSAGTALVEAIEACGALLAKHGLERASADLNELPDEPRLRDD